MDDTRDDTHDSKDKYFDNIHKRQVLFLQSRGKEGKTGGIVNKAVVLYIGQAFS